MVKLVGSLTCNQTIPFIPWTRNL